MEGERGVEGAAHAGEGGAGTEAGEAADTPAPEGIGRGPGAGGVRMKMVRKYLVPIRIVFYI